MNKQDVNHQEVRPADVRPADVRRPRCRARTPIPHTRNPTIEQVLSIPEENPNHTIIHYRPRHIYLNQQRGQLPIDTPIITLRSFNTVSSNDLIDRLTRFSQMLNEIDVNSLSSNSVPSNPTDISKFRTYTLNKQTTQSCAICLESMGDALLGEMVTELPCKHVFHKTCLARWFNTKNTCPLCKLEC